MRADEIPQFSETPRFVRNASNILDEGGLQILQNYLINNPAKGKVIQHSGGIRKLRWRASGRGKRGGSRIIYYFAMSHGRILLLDIYVKNEKPDLTRKDLLTLRSEMEMLFPWL